MRSPLGSTIMFAVVTAAWLGTAQANPGDLDPTFGTDGIVTTDFPGPSAVMSDMIQQTDGKLVAVGFSAPVGFNEDFTLARYDADGNLDTSFGTDGRVVTPIGSNLDRASAIAQQSDGKLVVAGTTSVGAPFFAIDFAVARYDEDGSLDESFGSGGTVTTGISPDSDFPAGVVVQPDGRIVVGGTTYNGTEHDGDLTDFALVRYNVDGSLDGSFGTGGIVVTPIGSTADFMFALIRQVDGKLVAVGASSNGTDGDIAVVRYNADGSLDGSFGTGGKVVTPIGLGDDVALSVVQQADGKLVTAGAWYDGTHIAVALVRYNADGSLDGSFGTGGKVTAPTAAVDEAAYGGVTLQPDGKILVAGQSGDYEFLVIRYNPDGTLDPSFGSGGRVTTSTDYAFVAQALIRQSDGSLVVGGGETRFVLARYLTETSGCHTEPIDGTIIDTDGDGVCDGQDNCIGVGNPAQSDGDDDGLGDACDPCTGGVAATKRRLVMTKLLGPPGDDKFSLTGEGVLPFPFDPSLDPRASGIRLLLADTLGTTVLDADVAGGAYDAVSRTGWKVNGAGTVWTYKNPGTHPQGITLVSVKTVATPQGKVQFKAKGKNGTYGVVTANLPLTATLILDPPMAETGQCVAMTWPAVHPAALSCTSTGSVVKCR